MFKTFDPAVIDVYVECALHDTPGGEVRLKLPVVHECMTYADQYSMIEAFELLGRLDPQVELRFVVGGKLSALCVLGKASQVRNREC